MSDSQKAMIDCFSLFKSEKGEKSPIFAEKMPHFLVMKNGMKE